VNPLKDFVAGWAGGKIRGFALTLIVVGAACMVGAALAGSACTGPASSPCSDHGWSWVGWVLGPAAAILFVLGALIFLVGRTFQRGVLGAHIPARKIHVDLNRVPTALQPIFAPPPPRSALEAEVRSIGDEFAKDAQELFGVSIVTHSGPTPPAPPACPRCGRLVVHGSRACGACGQPLAW
jgi:hypothetical protein